MARPDDRRSGLHVRERGAASADVVVLLHGHSQSGHVWGPIAERIAASGRRTLTPPRRRRGGARVRRVVALGALLLASACASPPEIRAGLDDSTVSAYDVDDSIVDGVDLSGLTDSPLRKTVTLQFDRPVGEVFDFLLEEVDVYSDDIMAVAFDNDASAVPGEIALGSVRICTMTNGRRLVEPLVAFAENRHYAYTTDPERSTLTLPVRDVVLFYTFEEKGPASTLVTVRAHYTPDVFLPMRPVVNALFKRNIDKTFAGAVEELGGRFVRTGG